MADSDPIGEIMARCALRDAQAFAQLYRQTAGKLYAVALRILSIKRYGLAEVRAAIKRPVLLVRGPLVAFAVERTFVFNCKRVTRSSFSGWAKF